MAINKKLQKLYNEVLRKIVTKLKERDDIKGIILFGSMVNQYTPLKEGSDIDLLLIVSSYKWGRQRKIINGIAVELFIENIKKIYDDILISKKPITIKNVAAGKILYEKDNKISFLKNKAKLMIKDKDTFKKESHYFFLRRYQYENKLKETQRASNQLDAMFLMNDIFNKIIKDYFLINSLFFPKRSIVMSFLEKEDNKLYAKCKRYINEINFGVKYQILEEIVREILNPVGGFLKNEWKIPDNIPYLI